MRGMNTAFPQTRPVFLQVLHVTRRFVFEPKDLPAPGAMPIHLFTSQFY